VLPADAGLAVEQLGQPGEQPGKTASSLKIGMTIVTADWGMIRRQDDRVGRVAKLKIREDCLGRAPHPQ